ncbi:hypothetical protein [Rickettsiella endosymbiont of Rhagonycha lignosa]|uniref:hypothetical protein n=1 Tax=Rickettsiella endosymbiont of Rhagonycha lignosa TaxID=3077937 RepID=UPI00313AA2DD
MPLNYIPIFNNIFKTGGNLTNKQDNPTQIELTSLIQGDSPPTNYGSTSKTDNYDDTSKLVLNPIKVGTLYRLPLSHQLCLEGNSDKKELEKNHVVLKQ